MSSSTHQIKVKGVDQTSGAFASVERRAAEASARMRGMLGGALAAAGAYLSLRSAKGGLDELGHLSDLALKTSTSIDELSAAAEAFNVLGIQNMSIENLAKGFDYLQKTTGRTGLGGMLETFREIAKIEDTAKRGQEAMRIFGRSGMEFMPLINGAAAGTAALEGVIAAMPRIPQAAADAGDGVADAFDFVAKEAKSIWLQGLGQIAGWLNNEYPGGVREGGLKAANAMTFYARVGVDGAIRQFRRLQNWLEKWGATVGAFVGTKLGGGSWRDALASARAELSAMEREVAERNAALDQRSAERERRWRAEFETRAAAVRKYERNQAAAAISSTSRQAAIEAARAAALPGVSSATPAVRNELLLGGSNASLRLAMIGPTLQAETKKQTDLLRKIADNTKVIGENTAETGEELGVVE